MRRTISVSVIMLLVHMSEKNNVSIGKLNISYWLSSSVDDNITDNCII